MADQVARQSPPAENSVATVYLSGGRGVQIAFPPQRQAGFAAEGEPLEAMGGENDDLRAYLGQFSAFGPKQSINCESTCGLKPTLRRWASWAWEND